MAPTGLTLRQIADACKGRLANPSAADRRVRTVATLQEAGPDDVTWIADGRHAAALAETQAIAIVGPRDLLGSDRRGILVEDAELAMAEILDRFARPVEPPATGVHPTAVLHPTVELGSEVAIGAGAVLGAAVRIGDRTIIHEGVTLGRDVRIGCDCVLYDRCVVYDRCELHDRVMIHAGTVIGADGFGYIFRDGRHRKLPHIGTVVIEDDVEIGANSCVDRAKTGATRIGRGSKIDNLVMVAHNAHVGPLCVIAGQSGLSGSVTLGRGVAMGGQAGVVHGIHVGDGAKIGAKSAVIGHLEGGRTYFGTPARERTETLRDQVRVRRLPRLIEQVAELSRRVAELEAAANHPKHD